MAAQLSLHAQDIQSAVTALSRNEFSGEEVSTVVRKSEDGALADGFMLGGYSLMRHSAKSFHRGHIATGAAAALAAPAAATAGVICVWSCAGATVNLLAGLHAKKQAAQPKVDGLRKQAAMQHLHEATQRLQKDLAQWGVQVLETGTLDPQVVRDLGEEIQTVLQEFTTKLGTTDLKYSAQLSHCSCSLRDAALDSFSGLVGASHKHLMDSLKETWAITDDKRVGSRKVSEANKAAAMQQWQRVCNWVATLPEEDQVPEVEMQAYTRQLQVG